MDFETVKTLGAALSSIKTITDIAATVTNAQLRQELNGKIADLQTAILTARQKMLEMQNEYEKVLQENKQLKEMAIEREKLRKHQNVYWKIENASLDGPFCPECLEHDNKLITLRHMGTMPTHGGARIIARYACTFHPQLGATILDARKLDSWKVEVLKSDEQPRR